MNFDLLAETINEYRGKGVEFGNSDNAPSELWILKAEERLGVKFPKSYKWFLNNCGGGEVYGEEIHSIYEMPFDDVFGGDIVFQTLTDRKVGFTDQNEISICSNDFGELFVFDTSYLEKNGEFPVFLKAGPYRQKYADSFAEFLLKRITNPTG